ncbi:MAG: acyl-CoA dehydrogenase family protein [Steroidobacteraceae bacterium]|nr:acyl-CoA dehydrogenase family protein [Steroidobacteraceae bacterium]
MDFQLTEAQQQLQREIVAYLEKHVTPELEAELLAHQEGGGPDTHPHYCRFMRQLGRDGWLGLAWPKQYGGLERDAIDQYIFFDTIAGYYRIPIPFLAINAIGATIMRAGRPEQKDRFLPPLLRGELNIAVGYTEPGAGTDLASLKTRAVRDGDHYVINGQKVFTSLAHFCDYIWLAARTDPAAKKHKGISIFMVDTRLPGVAISPLRTMGGFRSNVTFYDDVRVPKDCLIGEENKGWSYINSQLAMERIGLVPHSRMRRMLEDMIRWAKDTEIDDRRLFDEPWVREKLADLTVRTEVLRLFNFRAAKMITQGIEPFAEAAMTKVYGSELFQTVAGSCMDIMGLIGGLQPPSAISPTKGLFQRDFAALRLLTFGGGANEVLKDMIALSGLGMPPSRLA